MHQSRIYEKVFPPAAASCKGGHVLCCRARDLPSSLDNSSHDASYHLRNTADKQPEISVSAIQLPRRSLLPATPACNHERSPCFAPFLFFLLTILPRYKYQRSKLAGISVNSQMQINTNAQHFTHPRSVKSHIFTDNIASTAMEKLIQKSR